MTFDLWDWPNQQVVRDDHSGPGANMFTFNDRFARPDTAPGTVGAAPTGQTWAMTGSGYTVARISGQRLVCPADNVYAWVNFGVAPAEMTAQISWDGSGADVGRVALISSPEPSLLETMIHVTFTHSEWNVIVRVDNGTFDAVAAGSYTPCTLDGTGFRCGWFINGTTLTVGFPDDTEEEVTDPRFPSCNGGYLIYQLLNTAETDAQARFDEVWAAVF